MSGSLNKAMLIGNLGRDPEIRFTRAGDKIATFSIATSDRWKDKQTGEQQEKTEWHRVVIFDAKLAEIVEQYLKKGSKVYLEGEIQTHKWEKDGVERYSTEIVLNRFRGVMTMLGSRGDGPPVAESPDDYGTESTSGSAPAGESKGDTSGESGGAELDDEIPF